MFKYLFAICTLSISLTSCFNQRQVQYFQGSFDTTKLADASFKEPIIQKGDLISIRVYSANALASQLYNLQEAPSTTTSSGAATSGAGYLVDEEGNIELAGLGPLKIEGLTKKQVKELLDKKFRDSNLLINPYYTIRFLNYKVTVIGEVGSPGVYSIPNERLNLIEAIGLAGDITAYGRRDNIRIVRETNGKREFGSIDLTKPEAFNSPFFALQQNDIVYIEPVKQKSSAKDELTLRNLSIVTGIISTIAIVITVLRR